MIKRSRIPVGRNDRSFRPAPAWLRGMTATGDWLFRCIDWMVENSAGWAVFFIVLSWVGIGLWLGSEEGFCVGLLAGALLGPFLGLALAVLAIPLLWLAILVGRMLHLANACLAWLGKWQLPDEYERPRPIGTSAMRIDVEPTPLPVAIPERQKRQGNFLTGLVIGWMLGIWWDE
ncbi:hypothetical protein [Trichloromonas sp.]|uniref:hypothetical protein n=1 Tax=Trichloromonas sp. TaxID=3069249 RepID=UPI002A3BE28B|nr:hypothetical protein [Trichloromonas sp.]